jgi:phosphate transport system permease protein
MTTSTTPTTSAMAGRRRSTGDLVFRALSVGVAVAVLLLVLGIVVQLIAGSTTAFATFGLGFLTGGTWDVSALVFGALPFIAGTIATSLIAMAIAVPTGVATAVLLSEMAPRRVAVPMTLLVELIAAIPSVVIGLWGVMILGSFLRDAIEIPIVTTFGDLPLLGSAASGSDLLAASLLLALMVTPTIVAITREVLSTIPQSHREAYLGLGATRWEMIRTVVLPQARAGIVGASLLALGRAMGETMAVTMTIGNADLVPSGLFNPAQTIASKLATSWGEAADGIERSSLIALGLVLMVLAVGLVLATRLLAHGSLRRPGASS